MVGVWMLALPEGLLSMWGLMKCQFLYEGLELAVFRAVSPSSGYRTLEHQP